MLGVRGLLWNPLESVEKLVAEKTLKNTKIDTLLLERMQFPKKFNRISYHIFKSMKFKQLMSMQNK